MMYIYVYISIYIYPYIDNDMCSFSTQQCIILMIVCYLGLVFDVTLFKIALT